MRKSTIQKFVLASFLAISCPVYSQISQKIEYNLVQGMPNVYIDPFTESIGHTWSHGNIWDKPLIENFFKLLESHGEYFVVLDLGAQTGSFSLLSKFFPNSQWHSFEPIKEAADTLVRNLELNGIENVKVYNVAASNESGTKFLNMPEMGSWGLATLGDNVLRFHPSGEGRFVECVALDSFIPTILSERVHFMKLDTEGWEFNILLGAKSLIERDHPIILMEFNETNMKQCNVNKSDVEEFLRSMGYTWTLVSSEDILCIPN